MSTPLLLWAPTYWSGITITAENLTGTLADLLQADEGSFCQVTAAGNIVITLDLLTARASTHIALAGELLGELLITVERSSNNSDWVAVTTAAATLVNNLANIIAFTASQTYRYLRLTIISAPTGCRIYHVIATAAQSWPYMVDGFDPVAYKIDGTALTSPQGHLIGLQRNGCTRQLRIDFGQLSSVEVAPVLALFDECLRNPQGYFFQPDQAANGVFFGHTGFGNTYGAPLKGGLYEPTPVDFIARVP
jgi:hypothetical protein